MTFNLRKFSSSDTIENLINRILNTSFLTMLFFISGYSQTQFPWPVTPFHSAQEVSGAFAEYRNTSANGHYHNGTDIPKTDGSPVYAVKDGVVTSRSTTSGSNSFVRVNDLAYVHIIPNPAVSIGDSVFAQQSILGTIYPGQGHVHFVNGFSGSEKNSSLPGSGLTPFIDECRPRIQFIRFYHNNIPNASARFTDGEVFGQVDIMVKVKEEHGPPSQNICRRNNGAYKVGYKILSADTSSIVYEPPNNGIRFTFNSKPSNSTVNRVFFKPLSTLSSHVYQVTNNINTDGYWDTTDTLSYPFGTYVVMAFAEDPRGNTDTTYSAVTTVPQDLPPHPELKIVQETSIGMQVSWFPNTNEDLLGYRLYFSLDNENWQIFREESNLTAAVSDITVNQILRRDVYFRLTSVDNSPFVSNESNFSDTYGMSNGDIFIKKVLIVDGFDRLNGGWTAPQHDFAVHHGTAIIANEYSFDTVPNEAIEDSLTDLNDYEAVFWFLGDESGPYETFSPGEQALVEAFLENGGFLFVSGSEIASDLDQDATATATLEDEAFLNNYLKADFATHDAESVTAAGAASSIFEGLNFGFGQIPYQVETPDGITPVGAAASMMYDESQIAGVQFEGTFGESATPGKMVYLAFPFETIADPEVRVDVMNRVLNFFFTLTSIEDGAGNSGVPADFALLQNYPNPFNPETTIEFNLPAASAVSMVIYNTIGQRVRTLLNDQMTPGNHNAIWNGRSDSGNILPSGVYILQFEAISDNGSRRFNQAQKLLFLK